ncbi:toll/interleukin-1 receptor domain-containing protein [Paenibacillus sp. N3.4]|uniref:toll/interleukin-1 receptor domain-containing protein n=1 Tax=Paenibacillus sp. N3.4 TaxID=2603222 RepID=UPI0011CC16D7|nr:toll/interleukin-1 receptor domain-containing protein [Paenibacillus sp. N3.4]TXK80666.1 hypothetical protein FU659_17740 [Paenibacillus sp. N3.4]
MEESFEYHGYDCIGYNERVNFDGSQYTVGVLNDTKAEYLFTETISITGTAIACLFSNRNSDQTLPYLKERVELKVKARIDSGEFESDGRYVNQITSTSKDETPEPIDEQLIAVKVLTTLHNIRKITPASYKSEKMELKGFCYLFNIKEELLFYILSILEEKKYIVVQNIESGNIYILAEGIEQLKRLKTESPVKIEVSENTLPKLWDVFISHASEDKEEIVEPLALELQKYGIKV